MTHDEQLQQSDPIQQAIGGNGSLDLRPSMLATAKFLERLSQQQRHTEAVADCGHCNLSYAAKSIRRLIAAVEFASHLTQQLTDLRAWAAGVCGYTLSGHHGRALHGEYVRITDDGFVYVEKDDWRPDQNIAQAFEVLEATRKATGQAVCIESIEINGKEAWRVIVRDVKLHDSLCVCILLACRQAHEAQEKAT